MVRPYSNDLRGHVLAAAEADERPHASARRFVVRRATAYRWRHTSSGCEAGSLGLVMG